MSGCKTKVATSVDLAGVPPNFAPNQPDQVIFTLVNKDLGINARKKLFQDHLRAKQPSDCQIRSLCGTNRPNNNSLHRPASWTSTFGSIAFAHPAHIQDICHCTSLTSNAASPIWIPRFISVPPNSPSFNSISPKEWHRFHRQYQNSRLIWW